MDPLTQASLGAAAAAFVSRKPETRRALVLGALAGMAPDLDVLIRSESDPLLSLEYHRHFTHSLIVAPVIGLIVAALFRLLFFWKPWPFKRLALFGILGALTHGLLDTCTSYGTLLYWPFSGHRESWDIISIIDPLYTLPLSICLMVAFLLRRSRWAQVVLIYCMVYHGFGFYQRSQAMSFAENLAEQRGHQIDQISVRPSFGNIVLWRIVYRSGETYHVDAVQTLPFKEPNFYPGESVKSFTRTDARRHLPEDSIAGQDIERFRFFSQDYLYLDPKDPQVIGDLRYSTFPNSIAPLWGIRLDPTQPDARLSLEYFRKADSRSFEKLWAMIRGRDLAQ